MHKLTSDECQRLAAAADTTYRRTMCAERLYLYGQREADDCWRDFQLRPAGYGEGEGDDVPALFVVISEPVPWNRTREGLADWFYQYLRTEPLAMLRDAA